MKALARAIVRLYPVAWRRRYEDEVLSIIDAGPVRLSDVCGLLRNGITERVLSLYEPSRHITAYRFITGLALAAYVTVLFLAVLVAGAIPFAVGYLFQRVAGPVPAEWLDAGFWLLLPVFLVLIVPSYIRFFRLQLAHMKAGTPLPPQATKLRWVIVGGYLALSFFTGLETDLSFPEVFRAVSRSWFLVFVLWDVPEDFDTRWPGRGLFETLGRLRSGRHDLRWARMELDRCEGLYAGREPGPELRAARAEMDRLTAEEANAMAALDAMGYHARFSG